jgi:hypothetical protein
VSPSRLRAGVVLACLAARLAGADSSFTRFAGGGAARTDCMLVTDVAGVARGRTARCTDGDPTCDADGTANGACVLRVRLCLDATDPSIPRCRADVVTAATSSDPGLEAALATLAMPVAVGETCTEPVSVTVPRPGGRRGKLLLQESATMASGHADRDRVALVCRAPAPPATFATIERKVFGASCASVSCHGAAESGGLALTAGAAYGNLVGVRASNPAARAAGLLRVAPGDPGRSFLVHKLDGDLTAEEGAQMPRVGSALPASSIDLIRRWIAAGAPADAAF